MYSYKLNNSYTVYVNTVYLNECIKASKNKKKVCTCTAKKTQSQDVLIPIPLNTVVDHKKWGSGFLVKKEAYGIMTVAFRNETVRFVYPDAFANGHLVKH